VVGGIKRDGLGVHGDGLGKVLRLMMRNIHNREIKNGLRKKKTVQLGTRFSRCEQSTKTKH
jgi:hypothetical protein